MIILFNYTFIQHYLRRQSKITDQQGQNYFKIHYFGLVDPVGF